VNFIRTTADGRYYYEIMSEVVSVLHVQSGYVTGWGDKDLRMLDHFRWGPNLVRGFQTAGIGPRDLTVGTTQDALGGTMYWGTSFEVQVPIWGLPKDFGMRLAAFADAGSVWNYRGPTTFPQTGLSVTTVDPITGKNTNDMLIRSSVGAGLIWEIAIRAIASTTRSRSPRIRTTASSSCASAAAPSSSARSCTRFGVKVVRDMNRSRATAKAG